MASNVNDDLTAISKLTDKLTEWKIRARVTNKSIQFSYVDRLRFFFDLLDESGEIRATAFEDQCIEFYDMIEVGRVYDITNSVVKVSDKSCNPMNHEYEINFNYITRVRNCNTDTNISLQRFHFVKLDKIGTYDPGDLIDVIGICKYNSGMTTAANGCDIIEIHIVDDSQTEIQVTLWERQAEHFDNEIPLDSVIAIKGAKVSDFGGGSLYVGGSQIVEIDPNIDEARCLKEWYENGGS